jgi:hypothetical protein
MLFRQEKKQITKKFFLVLTNNIETFSAETKNVPVHRGVFYCMQYSLLIHIYKMSELLNPKKRSLQQFY